MLNLKELYKEKSKEIKEQPVLLFALVYPYVLIVGLVIGIVYVGNINQAARATVPAVVPDTTKQVDLKVIEPRTVPPVDIMAASEPTPELIAQGEKAYNTICQSCHGAEGTGNGPAATGLNPAPRNFTIRDVSVWKNGPTIAGIYKTLEEGIPNTAMVPYDYLLPEEKLGLAHYIRQNFVPDPPKDTPAELTTLDQTYQLSQGKEIPAQIPIEAAINLTAEENVERVQQIVNAVAEISSSNEEGANIFKEVTYNQAKALTALKNMGLAQGTQAQFVNSIVTNVNQNGFNGNVYKLNSNEWNTLQSFVSKYF